MNFAKTIMTLAALACMTANAFADTFRVNARSGSKVKITSQWIYTTECHSYSFSKVSFRQPANGKLSVVRRKVRIPKGKKCAGKLVNGFDLFYRSKAGFRGKDRGSASFTFDGGRNTKTNNARVFVNVK